MLFVRELRARVRNLLSIPPFARGSRLEGDF